MKYFVIYEEKAANALLNLRSQATVDEVSWIDFAANKADEMLEREGIADASQHSKNDQLFIYRMPPTHCDAERAAS